MHLSVSSSQCQVYCDPGGIEMITSMPENSLRLRFCRASDCGALFFVCKHCDRGQRYCSQRCRQEVRRQQRRAANSRYQRTERGRLAHLRRQRTYRQKCSEALVTDHGSHGTASTALKLHSDPPRCMVCQQENHWISPFDEISPRRWRLLTRIWGGASPKNYVFS